MGKGQGVAPPGGGLVPGPRVGEDFSLNMSMLERLDGVKSHRNWVSGGLPKMQTAMMRSKVKRFSDAGKMPLYHANAVGHSNKQDMDYVQRMVADNSTDSVHTAMNTTRFGSNLSLSKGNGHGSVFKDRRVRSDYGFYANSVSNPAPCARKERNENVTYVDPGEESKVLWKPRGAFTPSLDGKHPGDWTFRSASPRGVKTAVKSGYFSETLSGAVSRSLNHTPMETRKVSHPSASFRSESPRFSTKGLPKPSTSEDLGPGWSEIVNKGVDILTDGSHLNRSGSRAGSLAGRQWDEFFCDARTKKKAPVRVRKSSSMNSRTGRFTSNPQGGRSMAMHKPPSKIPDSTWTLERDSAAWTKGRSVTPLLSSRFKSDVGVDITVPIELLTMRRLRSSLHVRSASVGDIRVQVGSNTGRSQSTSPNFARRHTTI